MLSALLCCLRGSACIYQGEELGLTEADVPYEALQDPYGKTFWPNFKGRDGCRTPMPWNNEENAGFSSTQPWLPIPADHLPRSVARQEQSDASVLQRFRQFMRWRREQPSLLWGDIEFFDTAEPVLAFTRHYQGDTLLLAFNLSGQATTTTLPAVTGMAPVTGHGLSTGSVVGQTMHLPAYGCMVLAMA